MVGDSVFREVAATGTIAWLVIVSVAIEKALSVAGSCTSVR